MVRKPAKGTRGLIATTLVLGMSCLASHGADKLATPVGGQSVPGVESSESGSREGAQPTNPQSSEAVELVFQTGHVRGIGQVAISSDGRNVLTSDSEVIKLWDVASRLEVRSFPVDSIYANRFGLGAGADPTSPLVDFSPDGHRMLVRNQLSSTMVPGVAGSEDARVIDLDAGHAIARQDLLSADGRFGVTAAQNLADKQLTLTDLKTGEQANLTASGALAFSETAKYLVTQRPAVHLLFSGIDLVVWDVKTHQKVLTASIDEKATPNSIVSVRAAIVSERAEQLVLMLSDGSIDAYSLHSGQMRHVVPADQVYRTTMRHPFALDPSGRDVARMGPEGQIEIFDLASGRKVLAQEPDKEIDNEYFRAGRSDVADTVDLWSSFSADGRWFASGGRGTRPGAWLRVWDMQGGRMVLHCQAWSIAFGPDGQTAVLAPVNQGVPILHNLATGKEKSFGSGIQNLAYVDVTADGKSAITNSVAGDVRAWDLATARPIPNVGCPDGIPMRAARPSPRENSVLVVCADGAMRLLNPVTGDLIEQLALHLPDPAHLQIAGLRSLFFSRGGEQLAVVDDLRVVVWDLAEHRVLSQVDTSSEPIDPSAGSIAGEIKALGIDAHNHMLAVLRANNLTMWDFRTGTMIRRFDGPPTGSSAWWDLLQVREFSFNADGSQLEAGAELHLDLETGQWSGAPPDSHDHASYLTRDRDSADNPFTRNQGVLSADGSLWARFGGNVIRLSPASASAEAEGVPILKGHTANVRSVSFTPDGKRLLSVGADGALRVWSVAEKHELAALYALGESDFIAVTPDQYYVASREELTGISFRVHGELYPYEQFDLRFDRPDIVMERLGSASQEEIRTYRRAYERRMRKLGFTEQMLNGDFHLPEVRIQTTVPAQTNQPSLSLHVHASDEKYALDRVNVFVNDVPILGTAGAPVSGHDVHVDDQQIVVPLIPGANKIQVSALNQHGVDSLKQTVYTVSTVTPVPNDVYIVGIGVSHYRNSKYDLHYAAKDALDLMRLYKGETGADGVQGTVHLLDLTDERATREQIRRARDWLTQAHPNDLVIVFAAGHGMTDEQHNYYFGTYDIDPDQPQINGLPYEELEGLLDGIPALKKLLLLDTCFSGEIDEAVAVARPTENPDGTVKVRAFRPAAGIASAEEKARDAKRNQDVFVDLRRGTGAVVISSASADEYALEGGQWHNGVFTYAVLRGLKGEADTNRDGTITASELRDYVLAKVRQMTGGAQNPTIRRENLDFDFPIYGRVATAQ